MIYKIEIQDNKNLPCEYAEELEAFANGKIYNFKKGINIIVGENGCGKSTLLNMISKFMLCETSMMSKAPMDALRFPDLFCGISQAELKDGMKIYSDYLGTVYRLLVHGEMKQPEILGGHYEFSAYVNGLASSAGQRTAQAIDMMFSQAFSNKDVNFPVADLKKMANHTNSFWKQRVNNLIQYYIDNQIPCTTRDDFQFTFLIDEPDKNMDIDNIESLYGILSYQKDLTQLICVVHNPILIYKLNQLSYINFIEMSDGYLQKINNVFKNL